MPCCVNWLMANLHPIESAMPQPLDRVGFGEPMLGQSPGTAGHPGKGGGTGAAVGLEPSPSGDQWLRTGLPAPARSTGPRPHQVRASKSFLPAPGAAIGLHGTESPSNEWRNKSYKAGRDLLDFNILEIMRAFLLACNITGPNRITTRIYPHAFPWRWVGFQLRRGDDGGDRSLFRRAGWRGTPHLQES